MRLYPHTIRYWMLLCDMLAECLTEYFISSPMKDIRLPD